MSEIRYHQMPDYDLLRKYLNKRKLEQLPSVIMLRRIKTVDNSTIQPYRFDICKSPEWGIDSTAIRTSNWLTAIVATVTRGPANGSRRGAWKKVPFDKWLTVWLGREFLVLILPFFLLHLVHSVPWVVSCPCLRFVGDSLVLLVLQVSWLHLLHALLHSMPCLRFRWNGHSLSSTHCQSFSAYLPTSEAGITLLRLAWIATELWLNPEINSVKHVRWRRAKIINTFSAKGYRANVIIHDRIKSYESFVFIFFPFGCVKSTSPILLVLIQSWGVWGLSFELFVYLQFLLF